MAEPNVAQDIITCNLTNTLGITLSGNMTLVGHNPKWTSEPMTGIASQSKSYVLCEAEQDSVTWNGPYLNVSGSYSGMGIYTNGPNNGEITFTMSFTDDGNVDTGPTLSMSSSGDTFGTIDGVSGAYTYSYDYSEANTNTHLTVSIGLNWAADS